MSTVTPNLSFLYVVQSNPDMPSILSWAPLPTKMSSPPSPMNSSKPPPPRKMSLPAMSSSSNGFMLSPGEPSCVPSSIQSSPSLPVGGRLTLAPCPNLTFIPETMKSSPWPPKMRLMSSLMAMKSLPSPPRMMLLASAGGSECDSMMTSLPASPWMTSLPPPLKMMSSPAPPRTVSSPAPPSSRSLPSSPYSVSSPAPETMMSLPAVPPSTTWSSPVYCR